VSIATETQDTDQLGDEGLNLRVGLINEMLRAAFANPASILSGWK
jgi:hypothetical protein